MSIEITLDNQESLCWYCSKASDDKCQWVADGGKSVPDYVTKYLVNHTESSGDLPIIRRCSHFSPNEELILTCKRCGKEYLLQSIHTTVIDGGFCYGCHVEQKKTYCKPQPWGKPPREVNVKRKCPICGKTFVAKTSNNKYCSKECAKISSDRNNRARSKKNRNKASHRKCMFEIEQRRLEAKADTQRRNITQQYNADIRQTKVDYSAKMGIIRAEFEYAKENLEKDRAVEFAKMKEEYELALTDVAVQLEKLVEEARVDIYGKAEESKETKESKEESK